MFLCFVSLEAKFKKIEVIGFTTRFRTKDKKQKWFSICKNAGAIVKCLYVKTSESDVTKVTIQEWKMNLLQNRFIFLIVNSNEVQESIIDFIL
jgi:hypothetical protein